MMRALLMSSLAVGLLVLGCNSTQPEETINPDRTGGTTGAGQGGKGGGSSQTGGSSASGGSSSVGSGGSSAGGSGGGSTGGSGGGSTGTGGDAAGGSTGGGGSSGGSAGSSSGDAGGGAGGAAVDAAAAPDVPAAGDAGANGPGPGVVPLAGKAGVYICPLTATKEQCCTMLCECVNRICLDAPKAKAGLANCLPTCMKGSEMVARCHTYHCYESVSASGGKDHDSHCGHAANQVNGGGCPAGVLP